MTGHIGCQPLLSLCHIGMQFGARRILRDVDVQIQPGEFIGLIGPNGAGKSTLLKIVLGLQAPSMGNIQLEGHPIKREKQSIGYVPQKLYLDPQIPLRGRDLVALGLDGNRWGIPLHGKQRCRAVDEMLRLVDAERFADSPAGLLSGGEQQRLLIAQALLSHPKLLLLDEPLSNLDIKSAYEVVRLVSAIGKKQNVAVILVAHDMNPLLGVMDRVLYLADGNSVIGKVEDVFRSDVLSKLYGYPVEVLKAGGRLLVVGSANSEIGGYPLESDCCHTEDADG